MYESTARIKAPVSIQDGDFEQGTAQVSWRRELRLEKQSTTPRQIDIAVCAKDYLGCNKNRVNRMLEIISFMLQNISCVNRCNKLNQLLDTRSKTTTKNAPVIFDVVFFTDCTEHD